MDAVGVDVYCDLTSNLILRWDAGGYVFQPGRIEDFSANCADRFPGRFYGFTTANLAGPMDRPLFVDAPAFVAEAIAMLRAHAVRGARGLKVLKEFGLYYRDGSGALVFVDDERLAPIWAEAGRLGIPVLMHQSDPRGFFEPVEPGNEHYDSLKKYPNWSFADARFPRREEILEHRDRLVANHPETTFLLPHVANCAEDLAYVDALLERYPNAMMDCSARLDELGRQPYSARALLIKHQDRVCFGTDMPASEEMYRSYFRFFETFDEDFVPPDYDGTFGRYRWRIHGIGLPDEVLEKLYFRNIMRVVPGLEMKDGKVRAADSKHGTEDRQGSRAQGVLNPSASVSGRQREGVRR